DVVLFPPPTEPIRYMATESPGARAGAFQVSVAEPSPAAAVTLVGEGVAAGVEEVDPLVGWLCDPLAVDPFVGGFCEPAVCVLPPWQLLLAICRSCCSCAFKLASIFCS